MVGRGAGQWWGEGRGSGGERGGAGVVREMGGGPKASLVPLDQ